ncbi:MAG TPA: hypothetical protein VGG72_25325 [Bryobacteraceae bacterium]|jgi:hypothetical protein
MQPFVPSGFVVPLRVEHPQFTLRPLLISDVVKDYDAVMTSVGHLKGVFGPKSDWPSVELSLEQDLIDLGWHHKEFQRRSSFAYTMMNPEESQCLGCAYIFPTVYEGFDAEAYCWVRASHVKELDQLLFDTLKSWIRNSWPFQRVIFPGREPTWPNSMRVS